MSHQQRGGSIRAILRVGDADEPAERSDIELFDTVGAALDAGAHRLRSAGGAMLTSGLRIAVDVGEVDGASRVAVHSSRTRSTALLGAARPGQMLVCGVAAAMVAELPQGLRLVHLGLHRLHGVPSAVEVFEVHGDGLTSASIRTIDSVATSVPLPLTPLIGRMDLLSALVEAVRVERIVTLTGSGGSGKTRLAIEASLAHTGGFDVIHWAELAPLGSSTTLLDELAALVGVHHPSTHGRRLAVIDTLGRGRCLLVLDNAEHLVDAVAGLVTELVARCPTLHVLVTSREPLGLAGETVRRLPPLTLAATDAPDAIASSEAVVFLLDRLGRVGVDAALDDATLAVLHRICARLDGIPLALELAAARAAMTPLDELAAGLDERFRLLSATRRDAQPHQRTLEASIRWSHDLLPDDERSVFRRLAVFSDSFDAADVVAVDGGSAAGVTAALDRLVERSLVTVTNDGRLRLLETVRAFAEDRLEESGETTSARNGHLARVLTWAASIAADFDGPDPSRATASARRLLNDARAAIHHAEQTAQVGAIWRLIDHLAWFCFYDGLIDEALDWAARAATVDDDTHHGEAAPGLVAAALLATSRGDHEEIVEALGRAAASAERADDRRSMGRAIVLGAAHDSWHRAPDALPVLAAGRDMCASSGDPTWAAWGSCGAALALTFLGRPGDALVHLDDADAAASALRSRRLALDADARRCICEYLLGRWGDARHTIERGRRLAEDFTSISVTACFDVVDAWLAIQEGGSDAVLSAMDTSIGKYLSAGELQFIPLFADARARAMTSAGAPAEAAEFLAALRSHPGVEWASVYRHWLDHTIATAHLAAGDADAARVVAERLVADAADVGNHLDAARGEVLLARLDHRAGESRRADARTAAAIDTAWRLGAIPAVLDALDVSARGEAVGGDAERSAAIASGVAAARRNLVAGRAVDVGELVELARRGRGDRRRPTFGWDALTPTELVVTELVADGLTNPQIAERLIVGRATVKTHVSNVLRKLDLTGRTQLATAYRRRADEKRPPAPRERDH